jgi:hypothetical protein
MIKLVRRTIPTASALMLIGAASSFAQTATAPPPVPPEAGVLFENNIDINIAGAQPHAGFAFMAAPMTFDNETVAGAPYSAEAITEVVQSLADGNRIARQSKAELARDSAGRTRREQGLSIFGPMVNAPDDFKQVQITDPEAGTITLLDMKNKKAHKMPAPKIRLKTFEMAAPPPPPPPPPPPGVPSTLSIDGPTLFYAAEGKTVMGKPKVEPLGKQFIEGVEAEGTRTTFMIPPGQIGNELPINIVSERWLSPELKVLVMSRQSDPRFGETTYRLTNISRGEPSPSLFEIPSDFTVEDATLRRDVIFRRMVK